VGILPDLMNILPTFNVFDIDIEIHIESQLNMFRFVDDISSKMDVFPVSEIWEVAAISCKTAISSKTAISKEYFEAGRVLGNATRKKGNWNGRARGTRKSSVAAQDLA
jgi:hypothetical protein